MFQVQGNQFGSNRFGLEREDPVASLMRRYEPQNQRGSQVDRFMAGLPLQNPRPDPLRLIEEWNRIVQPQPERQLVLAGRVHHQPPPQIHIEEIVEPPPQEPVLIPINPADNLCMIDKAQVAKENTVDKITKTMLFCALHTLLWNQKLDPDQKFQLVVSVALLSGSMASGFGSADLGYALRNWNRRKQCYALMTGLGITGAFAYTIISSANLPVGRKKDWALLIPYILWSNRKTIERIYPVETIVEDVDRTVTFLWTRVSRLMGIAPEPRWEGDA